MPVYLTEDDLRAEALAEIESLPDDDTEFDCLVAFELFHASPEDCE